MATANLNITEEKPIASMSEPGPKTLLVYAQRNWPMATGQVEPSIPADINIRIKQGFGGSVFVEDTRALPNAGLMLHLLAQEVEVFAEYSNQQGLGTPYNNYQISGELIRGHVTTAKSAFAFKYQPGLTTRTYPNTTTYVQVPRFSTEVCFVGNVYGQLLLTEHLQVGAGNVWTQWYDLTEVQEWTTLSSFAEQFQVNVFAVPYSTFASDFTVAFR